MGAAGAVGAGACGCVYVQICVYAPNFLPHARSQHRLQEILQLLFPLACVLPPSLAWLLCRYFWLKPLLTTTSMHCVSPPIGIVLLQDVLTPLFQLRLYYFPCPVPYFVLMTCCVNQ